MFNKTLSWFCFIILDDSRRGGSDDDDDNIYGYIGIAVGAIMVIVITIVVALITLFICNRKKSR